MCYTGPDVLGEAMVLHDTHDQPLAGIGVLVTRAKAQAGSLQTQISALGGAVWELPVIATADPLDWAPLDDALTHLDRYGWLVVTSANGAQQVARRLQHLGIATPRVRIAAVGSATAQALEQARLQVDLLPSTFRGASLAEALAGHLRPGERILFARADIADPAPANKLRALGYAVDDLVAYRTVLQAPDATAVLQALAAGRIQYVTLTSSSTVGGVVNALGGRAPLAHVRVAVIGPETAAAAVAAGLTVHVQAAQATIASLVQALVADRATDL